MWSVLRTLVTILPESLRSSIKNTIFIDENTYFRQDLSSILARLPRMYHNLDKVSQLRIH